MFRVDFYEIDSFANGGNVKQILFGFVAAVEEVGFDTFAAGVQDGADKPLVDFGREIQTEFPGAGVRIGREGVFLVVDLRGWMIGIAERAGLVAAPDDVAGNAVERIGPGVAVGAGDARHTVGIVRVALVHVGGLEDVGELEGGVPQMGGDIVDVGFGNGTGAPAGTVVSIGTALVVAPVGVRETVGPQILFEGVFTVHLQMVHCVVEFGSVARVVVAPAVTGGGQPQMGFPGITEDAEGHRIQRLQIRWVSEIVRPLPQFFHVGIGIFRFSGNVFKIQLDLPAAGPPCVDEHADIHVALQDGGEVGHIDGVAAGFPVRRDVADDLHPVSIRIFHLHVAQTVPVVAAAANGRASHIKVSINGVVGGGELGKSVSACVGSHAQVPVVDDGTVEGSDYLVGSVVGDFHHDGFGGAVAVGGGGGDGDGEGPEVTGRPPAGKTVALSQTANNLSVNGVGDSIHCKVLWLGNGGGGVQQVRHQAGHLHGVVGGEARPDLWVVVVEVDDLEREGGFDGVVGAVALLPYPHGDGAALAGERDDAVGNGGGPVRDGVLQGESRGGVCVQGDGRVGGVLPFNGREVNHLVLFSRGGANGVLVNVQFRNHRVDIAGHAVQADQPHVAALHGAEKDLCALLHPAFRLRVRKRAHALRRTPVARVGGDIELILVDTSVAGVVPSCHHTEPVDIVRIAQVNPDFVRIVGGGILPLCVPISGRVTVYTMVGVAVVFPLARQLLAVEKEDGPAGAVHLRGVAPKGINGENQQVD